MKLRNTGLLAALGCLALGSLPLKAAAQANPGLPFYGYGSIVATPSYPVVGETATIDVTVGNDGASAATNVQVKVSFNDWGVTFQGWQEIGTKTIASIPAGGTATVSFDYVFQNRAHTCVEALIVGADENINPNDDRGQINLEVVNAGETFNYWVPVANNGDEPIDVLVFGRGKHDGPDGAVGNDRARPIFEALHLDPGETAFVEVEIDMRGLPDGSVIDFLVDAIDPNNSQTREHVLLRAVKTTPRADKLRVAGEMAAVLASLPKGPVANRFRNALAHLEKSVDPKNWVDGSHLKRNSGAEVFAQEGFFDRAARAVLPDLPRAAKIAVEGALRRLIDCDRILAQTAANEMALLLPAVQKLLADGDSARQAGDGQAAIALYKLAWLLSATK